MLRMQEVKQRCKRQAERKAPTMPGDPRRSMSAVVLRMSAPQCEESSLQMVTVDTQATRSLGPPPSNVRSHCVSNMTDGSGAQSNGACLTRQ